MCVCICTICSIDVRAFELPVIFPIFFFILIINVALREEKEKEEKENREEERERPIAGDQFFHFSRLHLAIRDSWVTEQCWA